MSELDLDALAESLSGFHPDSEIKAGYGVYVRDVLSLITAARERDALKAFAYHADGDSYRDLWKLSRANVGRIAKRANQLRTDGEDVVQMLIERDKEADKALAELATIRAERDALKAEQDVGRKDRQLYAEAVDRVLEREAKGWADQVAASQRAHADLVAAAKAAVKELKDDVCSCKKNCADSTFDRPVSECVGGRISKALAQLTATLGGKP